MEIKSMKYKITGVLLLLMLWGCSSTKLTDQWHSPNTPVYEANKVLVIGMSADNELRRSFEERLKAGLEKKNVMAVRSIDFFEASFNNDNKSEGELDAIEDKLLEAGFDAVLVSKIVGTENKVTMVQAYRGMVNDFQNFKDYYYSNQEIYQSRATTSYKIYHSETSVFCICPGKERELLWRGTIDIVDPYDAERNVQDYVRTLLTTLEDNQLVIVDE